MAGKRGKAMKLGVLAVAAVTAAPAGMAEPLVGESRNSFGMPGLIDLPSAEVAPDGTLGVSVFDFPAGRRTTLVFQIAPRLTGAFRYSRVPGLFSAGPALYDRSFDIHYQLLDEGQLQPAVAIGLRDFIGTGIYSSEYIVATKSITPTLRATAGLGWGRLGSKGGIGTPFADRPALDYGEGGKTNTNQWFRGEVAPFFGLSWRATDKLTLKAEYSSDGYVREVAAGELDRKSSVNIGAEYALSPMASVSAYYLYGSEMGVQFSLALDPHKSPYPSGVEKAPLPVRPRPSPKADPEGWSGAWTADPEVHPGVQKVLAESLAKEGQQLEAMSLGATRAEVRIRNERYSTQPQAIGRTARILTRALPPSVETIVITSVANGMPVSSVSLRRSDIEALENENASEILRRATITDALSAPGEPLRPTDGLFPRFSWALTPSFEFSAFDPNDPLRYGLGAQLSATYEFMPGLIASGSVRQRVLGNIGDNDRTSNSIAPHVRSDVGNYQAHGDLAIQKLTLGWYERPAENLYSRVTVGLLERMYGGISGEVLWKPIDSRLALGAEVNWVRQRDFDQRFDFRDYETVSGHASAYYDFGKGYVGQIDVGRYLAEDWGATFSLDREFANGWRVGAFATLTDMSEEEFGEGSFDKGIRITVPLAWITGRPSANKINSTIRPLTRDGGARVNVDDRLYDTVRGSHTGELYDGWGRFWR